MKVVLTDNILTGGQRLLAGTRVDLPNAADLIACGLAEAVEEAAPAEAPAPVVETVEAPKPTAKRAPRSRKAVAK